MPEVAMPLAALAGLAIFGGGAIALRLSHSLPTVVAFSGGIVVAVALLEILPEAIEHIGDAHDAVPLSRSASSPSSCSSGSSSCTTATTPSRRGRTGEYMGATDLLPTAHAHEHDGQGSWLRVALTVTGFVAIYGVTLIGHPG